MLVEKEVIRDGTYFYIDEKTKLPRKLVVTPELRKHWHDQGNAMLSDGLPIPVPYEHDFAQHPMTPKEQLLGNAGEVKGYKLKGTQLRSIVDVQDPEVKGKIGRSVRWTSPWFSSFTDGNGKKWENVISHLALTTRPRISAANQEPFSSIAAALSMATEVKVDDPANISVAGDNGFCLSRAGLLREDADDTKTLRPAYPMAFSLMSGGIKLSEGDFPPKKKKSSDGKTPPKKGPPKSGDGETPPKKSGDGAPPPKAGGGGEGEVNDGEDGEDFMEGEEGDDDLDPLTDSLGDVKMEELLCDLLQALGVPMPDDSNPHEFKRHLYEAAMCKIKDLAMKGDPNSPQNTAKANIPGQSPRPGQANPLMNQVQQEQQPMYMSLEDINKIPDETMKGIALSMYNENVKLRAEMDTDRKKLNSLNDAKLADEKAKRDARVLLLGKLSPRVKADLDAMVALPAMALSMGDGGVVVDPMAGTLSMLEKGLADTANMPRLLTTDRASLAIAPQPRDLDAEMTDERAQEIADGLSQQMGCGPAAKAS